MYGKHTDRNHNRMRTLLEKMRFISVVTILLTSFSIVSARGSENLDPSATGTLDPDTLLLIAYVLLALGVSFICSIAEAVLLSITPSYIEGLKNKRPGRAALLKRLKHDKLDQALAAILTLNTIAHTVGAIGAGAKATVVFGSTWFGLFSAVMTLLILFLSEIVPKTIGAIYWSKLAGPISLFLNMLIVGLYPIVVISERLTKMIAHGREMHVFSREEFIAMARLGENTGHIEKKESKIIRNLFRFESINIVDIMTPRTVISALPEDMSIDEALKYVAKSPFSRLPIYKTGMDDITGFVLKDDVLIYNANERGSEKLKSLGREIRTVPETISLSTLLEDLLKNRQHIVIVVDEYGGTKGLVTLEDVIETLMGMEIMDETDTVEDMRVLARKKWIERAKALGIEVETEENGSIGHNTAQGMADPHK